MIEGRRISLKVVFLGDTSVGKSCLAVRFIKNEFFEFQEPTIGAAFLGKSINLNNKKYKFEIWDTAGQERYRSLAPMYYRGAKAAVIVYDITDEETFKGAKTWTSEIQKNSENCLIVLVGNKVDLIEKRRVNVDDVRDYARDNNIIYMESSAKTGLNVEQIFTNIAHNLPEEPDDIRIHEPLDITIRDEKKSRYTVYTCC
ncbi:MAG: Rab family GTPase [Candidatus Hodarchaeales archaeon]|jgi:Ras-related protein Rab-5C